jgi:glycerol-3-phosphate dehydrogenase subunit C
VTLPVAPEAPPDPRDGPLGWPVSTHPADSIGLTADECLKCNVCNSVCPVMRVTDGFPGPKYVGPQAQRFRLGVSLSPQREPSLKPPSPDRGVDLCSGCGWCTTACPAGVKIAEINSRARAARRVAVHGPGTWRLRLRDRLISDPELLGRLGSIAPGLANAALHNRLLRRIAQGALGIHRAAPLPAFADRPFQRQWRDQGGLTATAPDQPGLPPPDRAVVYFHGCAARYQEPRVALAAAAVLERNGLAVIVPPQVCCGLPFISNGFYAAARRRARANLTVLARFARAGYRIVGTSTSCTHTLKAEYGEMLDLQDDDARVVAAATWDICELLLDLHEQGRLDTRFGRADGPLPYHAPCQLRSHGIGLPALDLLALVPGLQPVDLDHDCCGIAGTYGLKAERYGIAAAVGAGLFEDLRQSGASEAACDSETCRWQMEGATGITTRHPVEYLAAAYASADADGPGGKGDAGGAEGAGDQGTVG